MRDPLCSESYLLETIEFDKEAIDENKKDIVELKDDMEKGIQRYPRDNQSIIYATFLHMFMYNTETLIAKYS
ncbi:PoNe immunity protein domain-containing protein, partial [Acetivibrio straminisolvens]